jgi:hypothetical protein
MLLVLSAAAIGASWSGSFSFSANSVTETDASQDGRDFRLVQPVKGASPGLTALVSAEPGQPLLPEWSFTLVIPQGMRVAGVDCRAAGMTELGGTLPVFPGQTPVTFAQTALPPFVSPDPAIYGSDAAWPGRFAEASPVGIKSGFRLVTLTLHPLQYRPLSGRLSIAGRLAVTVRYEPDPLAPREFLTSGQMETFASAVRALVSNPADIGRYAPSARPALFGDVDYVIITSDTLSSYFQPLADWRTRQGFKTGIQTVSWITANYSGRDTQEKIRNFIIDYYNTKGTRWVLLGGDNGVVPCRQARALCGSETGNIPCDLYYGDIQGTWDDDNDNIFGEAGQDNVDFYYDLYVGRASVDNSTQVQTFVDKVLTHEKNPPTGYLRRMLMADALLWSGYKHRQSNDSIAAITPSGWTDVTIHDPGSSTAVRDSINNGFQFVHLVGHGNEFGIYDGNNAYYNTNFANGQTNGSRVNLINSIACYSGNFEYSDCVAEAAHNCTGGGSVGVIFNSRYGWGTPPTIGPSEILDVRFYDYFFNHDTMPIGITEALSKEVYRNYANSRGVWRWCYYETNLLGDPLLLMYKNVPGQLDAAFSDPIGTGNQVFTVTVTAASSPVAGALVCVAKGAEVYARDYTNSSGQVSLAIDPVTAGYMYVTATRANYLPDADTCRVNAASQGDVGVTRIVAPVDTVDSGTVVTPQAWVHNFGNTIATFPTVMLIGSGYANTRTVTGLTPGESVVVSFADWTAAPRGTQAVRCSTHLTGGQNAANDTLSGEVTVRVRDIGIVGINKPVGSYGPREVITPTVIIRNYGSLAADFAVWMLFADPNGNRCYAESTSIAGLDPVSNTTVDAFRPCTLRVLGDWTVKCSTALAGDAHADNNVLTGGFVVRSQWVEMKPMPEPPSYRPVKDGAWLACDAGSGLVYAGKGNKSGDFYSYNVSTDEWVALRAIPAGLERRLPRRGACGAADGSQYVYMAKGNNTLGFWRYDVATDTWIQLANVPAGGHRKVRAGAAVYAQIGDSGYVYLLKGPTCEFYRFNVTKWKWETVQPAPAGSHAKWYGGSFLVFDGDHTIYAHKARYDELWAYDVLTDRWSGTRLKGMPFVGQTSRYRRSRDGGSGAWFDGGVYALKGGNTSECWRYNALANTWAEFDSLPTMSKSGKVRKPYAGAGMVNVDGILLALKGNKTNELWRYDLGYATAAQSSRDGVLAAQTASGYEQLSICPNPCAGGRATVRCNLAASGRAAIEVIDASGRRVHSSSGIKTSPFCLDLRSMPAGVYLVKLTSAGSIVTRKLVIEKQR